MKIAICASEVVPYAKTGGLADVAGALPQALEKLGQEVIIVMPRYKSINESKFKLQRIKEDISYSITGNKIKVYFIEKDKYFNREGLYQDKSGDYKDNLARFSYYNKRTLELLKEINFKPDIIHVHDWQASLIPVYLKTIFLKDPFYQATKTILTIHNIGYQGLFPKEEFPQLGLDWSIFNIEGLEFYGKINILKGGMEYSDIINTVSSTYSKEIQTKEFGFGLEGVLNKRRNSLFGILNGLDYSIWNPETDKFISKNYSLKTIADKYSNKKDLQEICRLPLHDEVPLFGIVSRLAEQKGFDIFSEAMNEICKQNLQLVILGTGDLKYHQLLEKATKKHPKVISLHLKFDDPLAHKIYAGSDAFLMPSRYEPCGLGQLISLRYGTIPLVFKTGGLADTVNEDNGFIFERYSKEDLVRTIKEAVAAFKTNKKWSRLITKAMECNFSWDESAKHYLKLYAKAKSQ
ncbi:MAG: glycogen synthase GlgA [Candidatus Omnitrophica bacterium]|nr:glycogen synthase GlgA [Candidatus Omnitrophota bacterium]MDD5237385.1 glycogen synthase GlgA [Candidatus Omnitrophota bacterium]